MKGWRTWKKCRTTVLKNWVKRQNAGIIPRSAGNLDLPDLVEVQTQSFEWFIREGIREVFEDIYPIQNYGGNIRLEIRRLRIWHAKVYRQRVQIPGGEFRRAIESENGAGNGRQYNRWSTDKVGRRFPGRIPNDDGNRNFHYQRRWTCYRFSDCTFARRLFWYCFRRQNWQR